jgi:hypothetical protein
MCSLDIRENETWMEYAMMALLNWFASDLRIELRIQDIRLLCVFVAMPLSPCRGTSAVFKDTFWQQN